MKALSFILQLMICFGFSSIANAQIANYNFVYVSHFFSSSQNTSTHSKEPQIEIIYYNDSIPPLKWFDQYDTISGGVPFGAFEKQVTKEPDTIIERFPWVKSIDLSNYRVVSIINYSEVPQKCYFSSVLSLPCPTCFPFRLVKPTMNLQAKDENGAWIDIPDEHSGRNEINTHRNTIKPYQNITLIMEKLQGDYSTDLRFKLLVNAPPDFPNNKYFYSQPFKGEISKSQLHQK